MGRNPGHRIGSGHVPCYDAACAGARETPQQRPTQRSMDAILEPIGEFWEGFLNNPIVQLASQLIVIYVVLLWLGTAYWAFRDMQARTENPILPYFAAALIIFFTPLLFLFAVILYLIVRPRETLAEVYERSLAEESLLAEVEKNELCPVCRDRVDADWIVCPNCRTRLHRVCPSCNRLAEPHWPLCAYCGRELERPQRAAARQKAPEPAVTDATVDPVPADPTERGRLSEAPNT
jgi:Double zinc ribbon